MKCLESDYFEIRGEKLTYIKKALNFLINV